VGIMTLKDELIEAMFELGLSFDEESIFSDSAITNGEIYKKLEFYRNNTKPIIILIPEVENEQN
jgi:hypothetical protein